VEISYLLSHAYSNYKRVVREIRTLRAMWRALETGPRQFLNGHEEGNLGYKPRKSLRVTAPVLDDPTAMRVIRAIMGLSL